MGYLLAIDQGTTATTTLIIDKLGAIRGMGSALHPQVYPKPGWVEHDGHQIKNSVAQSVQACLGDAHISPFEIDALGITNQRETLCLFDHSNEPVHPFIVWQCRRSQEICERLRKRNLADFIHQRTGLHLDPYFSATKLLWLFEHYPNLKQQAQKGEVLVGTIDSFLTHWLSGNSCHITDVTNASRTMLMDINTCEWSDECCNIFSVPKSCLPTIKKNLGPFANTKGLSFLPDGIPIAALAGDQQAALFGQHCFASGDAKATFGTGGFVLLNTGTKPIFSTHGLLTSVAYQIDHKPIYCLEGSAFIAGAAIQFLIDAFGLVKTPPEIEELAKSVPDNAGVIFVPALCGLSAPYWRSDARGAFFGLSRATTKGHIARATLEGIVLQNTDIMQAMAKDALALTKLKVDGGASSNNLLMQMQADLLGINCLRSHNPHKTALGVAYMAGLAIGMYDGIHAIQAMEQDTFVFAPNPDRAWAQKTIEAYRLAVNKI